MLVRADNGVKPSLSRQSITIVGRQVCFFSPSHKTKRVRHGETTGGTASDNAAGLKSLLLVAIVSGDWTTYITASDDLNAEEEEEVTLPST